MSRSPSIAVALGMAFLSFAQPGDAKERLSLRGAVEGCILFSELKGLTLDDGIPASKLSCDKFAPDILGHIKTLKAGSIKQDEKIDVYKFGDPNVELGRCIDFRDGTASCTFYVIGKDVSQLESLKEKHIDEEFDLFELFGLDPIVLKKLNAEQTEKPEDKPKEETASLEEMLDNCVTESLATEVERVLDANGAQIKPDFPVLSCAMDNSALIDKLVEAGVGDTQTAAGADGEPQDYYLFGAPEKHLAQCANASGTTTCSFLFPGAKAEEIDVKRMNVLLVKSNMQDLLPLNKKTLKVVGPGRDNSDELDMD